MNVNYKDVGRRMSEKRKALGLKQYQVCEMIDVNYKYISNLETGRSAPSLDVLLKLCGVLNTTPDYLLLGIEGNSGRTSDGQLISRISALSDKNKRLLSGIVDLMNSLE